MKITTSLLAVVLALFTGAFAHADEKKPAKTYPLKTCIVTDEPLGGDHGDPYVFVHQGQEIKLCCKSCLKKFNKETAKYLKKLETSAKKKS